MIPHADFRAPVPRLLLLRHGESTWNVEGRWQGWLDAPLTPAGEEQAAERARTLAHDSFAPRVIYTSDLQRATRPPRSSPRTWSRPSSPTSGFRERNGGEWQGLTGAEIDAGWPGMRAGVAPRASSPRRRAAKRTSTCWRGSTTRSHASTTTPGSGIACIVTHHGMLRIVAPAPVPTCTTLIPNLGGFWFDVVAGTLKNPERSH